MDNPEHLDPPAAEIPDKNFFKIGEAAQLVGVKPYILRYWESAFTSLKPKKTSSRHRMYSRDDLDLLLFIRSLLYEQMYTIAGARKRLVELQQNGQLQGVGAEILDPNHEDPLEGGRVEALEQQVQMLEARLEAMGRERKEAFETAQMATDALKEVEMAREQAMAESEALTQGLQETEREYQRVIDMLQRSLDEVQAENESLAMERDQLREQLETAATIAAAVPAISEPVAEPVAEAAGAEGNVVGLEELQRARTALERAHKSEQDLRNKLRYQASSRQRVLKDLRSQVVSMLDMVHSANPQA